MSGSPAVPGRCTDVLVFVSPIVYIETVGFTKRSKRLRFDHPRSAKALETVVFRHDRRVSVSAVDMCVLFGKRGYPILGS